MAYDFSFSNPEILGWFDRSKPDAPIRQFIYVHEHPLISPNFISQMDVKIHEMGQTLSQKKLSGNTVTRLQAYALEFATAMAVFVQDKTEENALPVLEALRNLYRFGNQIKSM